MVFSTFKFIQLLVSLGTRQGESALRASKLIKEVLTDRLIPFRIEFFETKLPINSRAKLFADGKSVPCLPTSFVSGKILGKQKIVSSLIPSRFLIDQSNINFNPQARAISRSNFYFAPALAVSVKSISKLLRAKKVEGSVSVTPKKFRLEHILVGNKVNPTVIVFAHYDSIGPGAVDNASGVAVALSAIIKQTKILTDTLFVFDGNEELSYDKPTYWGRGFRIFEERHLAILIKAKSIIVVDSVGNGKPQVIKTPDIINLAFPIRNRKVLKKTVTIAGDISKLMSVYHSEDDLPREIKNRYLQETLDLLLRMINRINSLQKRS